MHPPSPPVTSKLVIIKPDKSTLFIGEPTKCTARFSVLSLCLEEQVVLAKVILGDSLNIALGIALAETRMSVRRLQNSFVFLSSSNIFYANLGETY